MAFWHLEQHPGDTIALISAERSWTYGELAILADDIAAALPSDKRTLGFVSMPAHVHAIATYLGALRSGRHVPLLMQESMDANLQAELAAHYHADWLLLPDATDAPAGYASLRQFDGMTLWLRSQRDGMAAPHDELGMLLNTSGSTGSAKLVRLSYEAMAANATSIARYLGLRSDDRAITTLPLAYSFGMSILNSHLECGASLVLTSESLVGRPFWELARQQGITSLSGVPATFEMLRRTGLERFGLDRLRMLTQAGGRLRDAMIEHFLGICEKLSLQFFVMYGQTEAAPRISYVPPARLKDKIGSIGVSVPGGMLEIDAATQELVFRGPNVMMGYAQTREELSLGDVCHGMLRTGDLARVDDEGFHYLTGRIKRFIKVSGNRINLDEVERMLATELSRAIACSGSDDRLVAFVAGEPVDEMVVKTLVQNRYKLFPGHIHAVTLSELPLLSNGKTNYQALAAMSAEGQT